MAKESVHKKLSRVRAPRVHITYDVEVGDAIEMKELPFVVGVFSDLSGKPDEPLPGIKERKFVEIDRDNFDEVLTGMKPRLAYTVENKLSDDDTKLGVELRFKALDDFHPENVVKQVEPLRKLLDERERLSGFLSFIESKDKLRDFLDDVTQNTEDLKTLSEQIKSSQPKDKTNGAAESSKKDK